MESHSFNVVCQIYSFGDPNDGSLKKSPSIIFILRSWLKLKKKKRLKYHFGEMKYSNEQKLIKLWT